MMQLYLTHGREKHFDSHFLTCDIETAKENGSALLGDIIYVSYCFPFGYWGEPCYDFTSSIEKYFLLDKYDGWIMYIHNGFHFDYQRIGFRELAEKGYEIEFLAGKDNNIKGITIRKDESVWYLRDSYLLIPLPLRIVTDTFSPETPKQEREKSFDEYPFNVFDVSDIYYSVMDSYSLYISIENIDKILKENFNVSIHDGVTLPSLAYRAMRNLIKKSDKKRDIKGEKFPGISFQILHAARDSYYGGQTITFDTKFYNDVISIDCNSMYAWVMQNFRMPTGEVKRSIGPPQTHAFASLCLAIVHIPEGVFPLLKSKNEKGKPGNYCGIISGWFWMFELEQQRELGASYEIIECFTWNNSTDILQRFSKKCHDLRMTDYNGPVGTIAKNVANSVYGKFAQESPDYIIKMILDPPDDAIPFYSPQTKEIIDYLWQIPSGETYRAHMTHWASYITSRARCKLTGTISQLGFDKILSCDTDSLFFERKYLHLVSDLLGAEYGQFKIEKGSKEQGIYFQAVAPKAYKYMDNSEIVIRNKGIPKNSLKKQFGFVKLGLKNKSIKFVSTKSLLVNLKQGSEYGRETSRRVATSESTTNGKIIDNKWMPVKADMRPLEKIRGLDARPSNYLSNEYAIIMARYNKG